MNAALLNAILLGATSLNATPLKRIVYKNNAVLFSKVWRKYKRHYSTGFKSYQRWNAIPLNAVPLNAISLYKMNAIINKFLLTGDKFMPEMHLKQPASLVKSGFTYSAWGPFTKHRQRIEKFMQTGDTNYIYKNELDKACFAHDVAYSSSRHLAKRTAADKILRDKAFNVAKDPEYDGYQRELASMVYKFFDKKTTS